MRRQASISFRAHRIRAFALPTPLMIIHYVDKRAHHRFGSLVHHFYLESRRMNMRSLYAHRAVLSLLVASALAVASLTVLVIRQQRSQADGQVFLQAGGSVGPNPFIPPVIPAPGTGVDQGARGISGQMPANTDDAMSCDRDKLVSYLTGNPQVSEAWVRALNYDHTLNWSGGRRIQVAQIPSYLRELTMRRLADDLRVTNYQFTNGAAVAVQTVLEKGTAVLVDAKGVARVRCICGNPLTPMVQLKVPPTYRGTPWPSFQPQRVIVTQGEPPCRDTEYRGDDGRCRAPSQPQPARHDKRRPLPERWQDQPAQPPYAEQPGRPEEHPSPDESRRPDELHPGKPSLDGPQSRYPDSSGRSEEPRHPSEPDTPNLPDQPTAPDYSKHTDKPRSPAKAESPDTGPVSSDTASNPASHSADPSKADPHRSARPGASVHSGTEAHESDDPPRGRRGQQDRPDKPAQRPIADPPGQPAQGGKDNPRNEDRLRTEPAPQVRHTETRNAQEDH
jgi:hypothetical protein